MNKPAAIYARVSSDRQKDNQTIASQTAALKEYARTNGYAVPAEWVFEDEGFSGANLARPGLEALRLSVPAARALPLLEKLARGEAGSQLAGVKAVTDNYPLRGRLRIASAPNAPDAPAAAGPARGSVWVDERLVSALGAPVGARLKLGSAE